MSGSHVYRFGEFHLDPAARELRRNQQLVEVPRLTFDGLVFLVENRDHAVSRDELINHVWGKPYVEDIQVTHLIMRIRRILGDSSNNPSCVRTVSGFGYHWIADMEVVSVPVSNDSADVRPASTGLGLRRKRFAIVATGVFVLLTLALAFTSNDEGVPVPLPREGGEAVVVLPMAIIAADEADTGWIRLGMMDLIGERLRLAGLPVPPSDSIILALHVVGDAPAAERMNELRTTLGADVVIEGRATRTEPGWVVELVATTADGNRRRVESIPADIMPAAKQATNLLLAAFGHQAPAGGSEDETLGELLQRVRSAVLALELEAARGILEGAPGFLRDHPEVRYQWAWIAFQSGELETADTIISELLNDSSVLAQPRLFARGLVLRGSIATHKRSDRIAAGLDDFDAAVKALEAHPWASERGAALALRGLARAHKRDFEAAASDLGEARQLFEVAGDRLNLSRYHNYFGHLRLIDRRPIEALSHFQVSLRIAESFGHQEWTRAGLTSLVEVHAQLLQWPDALATSERLWTLAARLPDPVLRHFHAALYAAMLVETGRLREATAMLEELDRIDMEIPANARFLSEEVRARLAWYGGQLETAMRASALALALRFESSGQAATPELQMALLHQRASLAVGQPVPALQTLETASYNHAVSSLEDEPIYLVAQAEWAAYRGNHGQAEWWFGDAMKRAEQHGVPHSVVTVADAYSRWLITRDRAMEAVALAGRIAEWAERDYASALTQAAVFHAAGQREAWMGALRRVHDLAGERQVPSALLISP